jgi:N-acetylmuramoyl-L-alanine amidase
VAIATWVGYPRSYSKGRNRPVQYVVIHYTAGSEGPTSAEAGAAYDKVRTDGTSCHTFADSNSVVREVPDIDRAHAARHHGNEIGLQLEICGTAQTRAQWLDATSTATLRLAAMQTAEWCRDHALPVRRLTVAQTRAAYYNAAGNRPKGIVGHVDCTQAYPEDGGTHTDPGKDFPWDLFLAAVARELAALTTGPDHLEVTMFLAQIKDDPKVYLSDGQTWRDVKDFATMKKLQAAGVKLIVADDADELADLCGAKWQPPGGTGATGEHTHATGPALTE